MLAHIIQVNRSPPLPTGATITSRPCRAANRAPRPLLRQPQPHQAVVVWPPLCPLVAPPLPLTPACLDSIAVVLVHEGVDAFELPILRTGGRFGSVVGAYVVRDGTARFRVHYTFD